MSSTVLVNGGPVVAILLCFSLVGLSVAFYKLWQFWGFWRIGGNLADQSMASLQEGHRQQALMLVRGSRNPRCALIRELIGLYGDARLKPASIREEGMRQARAALAQMSSYLRVLEIIAVLAPLLGLFGTVLGMIEAFQAMESAGAQVDPAVLSGGIWQALLTTAVGLAVAIPVSLLNSMLERRVEVEALAMQDDMDRFAILAAVGEGVVQSSGARLA